MISVWSYTGMPSRAGIKAPLKDQRGKLLLVVENKYAADLAAELTRLEQDLTGDGWQVTRFDVSRADTPASVKQKIKARYIVQSFIQIADYLATGKKRNFAALETRLMKRESKSIALAERHIAQRKIVRRRRHLPRLHHALARIENHIGHAELFRREMHRVADAARAVIERAGMRLGERDELLHRACRHTRMHCEDEAHAAQEQRHRDKVFDGIVRQILVQRDVRGHRRIARHQQRVAIGRRLCHMAGGEVTARADHRFHKHRLAQDRRQLVADEACADVRRTAGGGGWSTPLIMFSPSRMRRDISVASSLPTSATTISPGLATCVGSMTT